MIVLATAAHLSGPGTADFLPWVSRSPACDGSASAFALEGFQWLSPCSWGKLRGESSFWGQDGALAAPGRECAEHDR